jgi:hypothetical protein
VERKAVLAHRRFSASLSFAMLAAKTQFKATMVTTPMNSTIIHLAYTNLSKRVRTRGAYGRLVIPRIALINERVIGRIRSGKEDLQNDKQENEAHANDRHDRPFDS